MASISEVGYAFRARDDGRDGLELWRREDPYVDDDPTNGGKYSLIYDRVRECTITYYPRPTQAKAGGQGGDPNGEPDWDSRLKKRVPYAIIVELSFFANEPDPNSARNEEEPEKLVRIFLLKPGNEMALDWPTGGPATGTPSTETAMN